MLCPYALGVCTEGAKIVGMNVFLPKLPAVCVKHATTEGNTRVMQPARSADTAAEGSYEIPATTKKM